ncbi:MAG: hypothetical protein R3F37_08535 [Candidatus Competibacteraceae bacterium]
MLGAGADGETVSPLPNQRGAAVFEALRDAAEALKHCLHRCSAQGVFGQYGTAAATQSAGGFFQGFLEVGGFDVIGDKDSTLRKKNKRRLIPARWWW